MSHDSSLFVNQLYVFVEKTMICEWSYWVTWALLRWTNLSLTGVTVFLSGMAIALLGSRCHAPSLMLSNFIATPIELRYFVRFQNISLNLFSSLVIEINFQFCILIADMFCFLACWYPSCALVKFSQVDLIFHWHLMLWRRF